MIQHAPTLQGRFRVGCGLPLQHIQGLPTKLWGRNKRRSGVSSHTCHFDRVEVLVGEKQSDDGHCFAVATKPGSRGSIAFIAGSGGGGGGFDQVVAFPK